MFCRLVSKFCKELFQPLIVIIGCRWGAIEVSCELAADAVVAIPAVEIWHLFDVNRLVMLISLMEICRFDVKVFDRHLICCMECQ